jgi:hypothetical protein
MEKPILDDASGVPADGNAGCGAVAKKLQNIERIGNENGKIKTGVGAWSRAATGGLVQAKPAQQPDLGHGPVQIRQKTFHGVSVANRTIIQNLGDFGLQFQMQDIVFAPPKTVQSHSGR